MNPAEYYFDKAEMLLGALRSQQPLVHCMTNHVVTNFTANVLLAAGAAPAMIYDAQEAEIFAAVAGGLLVNVGTLEETQLEAMRRAVAGAQKANRPWVLDPVAVGVLPLRTKFAEELLSCKPSMIRGNASEIMALAGEAATGRGVDSTCGVEAAAASAHRLADFTGGTVLVTGAEDLCVKAGSSEEIRIANGTPLLTRVTGVGCSQGALCAALCAVSGGDTLAAAVTAALMMGIAGDRALRVSSRPGSFAVALLDELDALCAEDFRKDGKLSV